MENTAKATRAMGERACLAAWMLLMVANTVIVGLSIELIVFAMLLSFGQITLIDEHTMPFLSMGFVAMLTFPVVVKLHTLGVQHLNFEIHENILSNASESWENIILTLIDQTALRSRQLEKFVQEIEKATDAAERQERRTATKAWLIANEANLTDEDRELVDEHLGYLKWRR